MDSIEKVTPKLEVAVTDLMDSETPNGDSETSHPANPRHASVNVKRAANALRGVLEDCPELSWAHGELWSLHRQLKTVDILRGERGYEPFRRQIKEVLSTCEWKKFDLAEGVPKETLARRKHLRNWSRVPFRWGIVFVLLGVVFGIAWISDLKERMHVQSLREVLRRRREETGNVPPEDLA